MLDHSKHNQSIPSSYLPIHRHTHHTQQRNGAHLCALSWRGYQAEGRGGILAKSEVKDTGGQEEKALSEVDRLSGVPSMYVSLARWMESGDAAKAGPAQAERQDLQQILDRVVSYDPEKVRLIPLSLPPSLHSPLSPSLRVTFVQPFPPSLPLYQALWLCFVPPLPPPFFPPSPTPRGISLRIIVVQCVRLIHSGMDLDHAVR